LTQGRAAKRKSVSALIYDVVPQHAGKYA
jgi:hypothetical protein